MQKSPRNPNFGYDTKYYPPTSIMIEFRQFNAKTNRENKAYKIYEEDYLYGLAIYQQKFKIDYIKKITNLEHKHLEQKIIASDWTDDIKLKKLLILEANVNQLKFYISDNKSDRNNNLFHLLNLIVSLREIFDKDIKDKLTIKYWDFSENQEIIRKSDWEAIKLLENVSYINNSKVNLWKKVKTLRDIWTHYYKYIPNPCINHKNDNENCLCNIKNFILLKIIFWKDDIYFFIIEFSENKQKLIIVKYNFINIKNILDDYLKAVVV